MKSVSNIIGNYRWTVVALLFFSTTINYMDRQVIGYLKLSFSSPVSEGGLGWSNKDYAIITSAFTMFYALMTFGVGFIIDKIGTKIGLTMSLAIWSALGVLNAFAGSSVVVHAIIRSFFGMAEAGNFPAAIKAIAEWFPKKERALATGIFNSGSNFGAMLAAIIVPLIAYRQWFGGMVQGWQMSFIFTGAIGFIWLIFWVRFYESPSKQKRLSKAEYDYIHADGFQKKEEITAESGKQTGKWYHLLAYRQTWLFISIRFLTDGVWWFLLFWLPDFMKQQFNMEGQAIMMPLFIVYAVSIAGSVSGGGLPVFFMNRGAHPFKAKTNAMLLISLLPLSLLLAQYFGNVDRFGSNALFLSLAVIALAAAAHQAWAANMFTTISDLFPKSKVASVTGIGGLAGGLGGIAIQMAAGYLTDYYHVKGVAAANAFNAVGLAAQKLIQGYVQGAYGIMFMYCACAYLLAWMTMKLLVPVYKPVAQD